MIKKPIDRSKIRLLVGRVYYSLKTYYYWYFSGTNFAKKLEKKYLPMEIYTHKTVLRRSLKNVDLWMQENKITNLKIAIKSLNGLVLEPGQTFSYWRQIGKATRRKGYLPGMMLHKGTVISGVGGGLCQLSNLLYWITLHSPLTVVERWRHSYDVFPDVKRDQPFGTGATCAYPNIDLQIKNGTQQKFQLQLEVTNEYLIGRWLSDTSITFKYEIVEKDHKMQPEWWGGYSRSNKIFRKILDKKTDKLVKEEFIVSNHAMMMYEPLIEESEESFL